MPSKKIETLLEKGELHPRNKHRQQYDFKALTKNCPELATFVKLNEYKNESVDFFNPEAVKTLNKALLKHYYHLSYWDIPTGFLCPPVPGRADYVHHLADLLGSQRAGKSGYSIPMGPTIKCLDVGVGANSIYPILGTQEYGWSFVGSDIDQVSIASVHKIIDLNKTLQGKVEVRLQPNANDIFKGIIQEKEFFDLTICNPPFHASQQDAQAGTVRKLRNLKGKRETKPILNFGGQHNELWCQGGEATFIGNMIRESKSFANSCFWFTTLVSKSQHLEQAYKALEIVGALEVKTIPMAQGNKVSRILAWTFLSPDQKKDWIKTRWK